MLRLVFFSGTVEPQPTRTSGRKSRAKPKEKTYTEAKLRDALVKIQSKALTVKEAAKLYQIPVATIRFRLRKKPERKVLPCLRMSVTKEEDVIFKNHLLALNEMGIPVVFQDISYTVKSYLDAVDRRGMRFKNNMPGTFWCKHFLERYPEVKEIIMFNDQPTKQTVPIDNTTVNDFFDRLQRDMHDVTPDNIYNIDECGFEHDPKKKSLLFRRPCRHPDLDRFSIKSMYTVVFCGNAIGEMIPPFAIFKEKPATPSEESNKATSATGWIDTNVFEHWLEKHFLPIVKDKPGNKVLICDNLSAHVSVHALQLCEEHDIKFICPVGNSSHLHPFDVEFYEYLQCSWRIVLNEWRETPTGQLSCWQKKSAGSAAIALPKDIFWDLVNKAIEQNETTEENLIEGFKKCGIHPLSRFEVLQILEQELEEYLAS